MSAQHRQSRGEARTTGIFNLPQAPIFRPTEDEFQDPWKFLLSISKQINQTGICVIQPPAGKWDFEAFKKHVNPKTFSFETKAQNVHQMQNRAGPNTLFLHSLKRFWLANNRPLTRLPVINGATVDMFQLHLEVERLGGFTKVDRTPNQWQEIGYKLRVLLQGESNASSKILSLRSCFIEWLQPFIASKPELPSAPNQTTDQKSTSTQKEPATREQKNDPKKIKVMTRSMSAPPGTYTRPDYKQTGRRAKTTASPQPEALQASSKLNEPPSRKRGRSLSDPVQSQRPQKRTKLSKDPIWKQVKSRSFATQCGETMEVDGWADSDTESEEEIITDFGYDQGQRFTLESFEKMANNFEDRWAHCTNELEKEREYWKIITASEQWVQVQYGSDLDVEKHQSGFPLNKNSKDAGVRQRALTYEKEGITTRIDPYMSQSGWNTNNLPGATFLHHLNESVGGVTRPMIYVGMLFSSFCWHNEDNYLYSINYLHTGKPKLWYGVPGSAAGRFEALFREKFPELFKKNPNLLHLLVTQFPPKLLQEAGIPVCTTLQHAGQFIVTCPKAFHGGFNTGFNVAESVNFALEDWLPLCEEACQDYRYQRSSVFPYEEFVLKAIQSPDSPQIRKQLGAALKEIIKNEETLRKKVKNLGIEQVHVPYKATRGRGSKDRIGGGYQSCFDCGFDCYLSAVVCTVHPDNLVCLCHVSKMCKCSNSLKKLQIRKTIQELKNAEKG